MQRLPLNLREIELFAETKTEKSAFDYLQSGSDDEISTKKNESAFQEICLLPRVLVNIEKVSTSIRILGIDLDFPVIIGPTAFHGLFHEHAEIATARASQRKKTIMTVSTMANKKLEEIKEHAENAWFQLYVYKNRKTTEKLVNRAQAAGYKAIVVTVDCPLMGNREKDKRNNFKLPKSCVAANFSSELQDLSFRSKGSSVFEYTNNNFDNTFTWDDIKWLKSITDLPIILKGILHPDDAELALKYGIAAIIVSNHGGRQVDTTPPTIEILPEIARVTKGKIPILIDGGIRRGTDIIKAISLGASAVLIGRPILWGLAINGQEGVEQVLSILEEELRLNMALCGYSSIKEIQTNGFHNCFFKSTPQIRAKL